MDCYLAVNINYFRHLDAAKLRIEKKLKQFHNNEVEDAKLF